MATDTTNLPQDMNSAESESSAQFDAVQIAQASPAAPPVQIVIPAGAKVVRVPVTPGEIVELPFGADAHLLGKLGDNGNLAIKVGEVTVILEGYTAASGQQQVIIEGLTGQPIDIASVLAATDPTLDIQTAAGGAEGAQGADNTGAIFAAFGPGNGLGGFGAEGALGATELQYKLIDAEQKLFVQEVAPPAEPDSTPVIIEVTGGLVNEDDLRSRQEESKEVFAAEINPDLVSQIIEEFCTPFQPLGNDRFDVSDAENDADDGVIGGDPSREPTFYDGKVTVDFGTDAPGSLRFPVGSAAQMEALGLSSNGYPLHFQQLDDTHLQGYIFDGECYSLVMTVTIAGSTDNSDGTTTFDVVFALDQNLDHPLPAGGALADETDLPIPVPFEAVDNNGTVTGGSIEFDVRDDIPFIGYPPSGEQIGDQIFDLAINDKLGDNCVALDETTVLDGAEGNGYGYTDAYGYFAFNYGADGPWDGDPNAEVPESPVTLALKVVDPDGNDTGIPVDVTGSLKSGGVAVTIDAPEYDPIAHETTIRGHLEGSNTPVFVITVSDGGAWTSEFLLPLDHPDAGETGSDDQLQFQLTVTIKDDDGDQAQTTLCIDLNDGGPTAQNDVGNVDESTTPISVDKFSGVLSNDSFGPDGKDAAGGVVGVEKGDTGTADDDSSTVGTIVHGQFGDLTLNADGSYSYAMTGGEGNDVFTYTIKDADGDLSHATLTFTVDDQVLTPTVGVNLEENELCISEDGSGSFIVTANTADNTDQLTQLTFTELKDLSDAGWTVAVAGTGGTTGSFDLTTGIFTISNVGAQTANVEVTLTPPADSDRDVLNDALADITVTATAQDISTPALTVDSGATTVVVHVDAVADPVTANIVVSDGVDANASFQLGEAGSVQVNATFGDAHDGSESHTVVLTVPVGFFVLDPAGGIYNPGLNTVTWTVGADVTSFTPLVAVQNLNPGNVIGAIFTITSTATETLPAGSGEDCDLSNNTSTAFNIAPATVANADAPRADLSLHSQDTCVLEDSTTASGDNVLSVTAGAAPGSHLTTIVLSNLDAAGWSYDFSGLAQVGFIVGPLVAGTITITAVGPQTSYAGTFAVQPPANSDADYPGTIGLDATAASDVDPLVTAHTTDTQVIHVDAVADPVTAAIEVNDGIDANSSWQTGESGTVKVTATFGDNSDGSETHTVVLHIPAGFSVTDAAGGTYNAGAGTVTWTDITDASFIKTVTVTDVSASDSGSFGPFTVDVDAVEKATVAGPNGASGVECDDANNAQHDDASTNIVVANGTPPSANLSLAGNDTCVLEDSTTASGDNVVSVSSTAAAGSHLTTIVISNLDPSWAYNFAGLAQAGFTVGPVVAGTITITANDASQTAYNGSFAVQPPANSDVDFPGTIGLDATAASNIDPSVTANATDSQVIHVDAVADPVTAAISVTDSGDANTSWQTGETGAVHITATFGDASDGSETHTVVLHIPVGFIVTNLPVSDGGVYDAGLGTVTWTVGGGVTSFTPTVTVQDVSGANGALFSVDVDAVEKATVAGPNGASGVECDNANNAQHDDDSTTVVVANVTAPSADLQLAGNDTCVLEDSTTASADNVVGVTASATAGSHLTTIVLTNLNVAGWTYNFAGLAQAGFTVGPLVAGTITITANDASHTTYTGSFAVQPPANTDIDYPGTIGLDATAASNIDPSVTAHTTDTQVIHVDAVADPVTAAIEVNDGIDANSSWQTGESGTVKVTATFGDNSDGSETHTVVLHIPAGFSVTDAAGGTYNAGAGTVTWTDITDASFIKNVIVTDVSATNSGAYGPFSVDVDAVEKATVAGPNGASGVECDDANNAQHDDDSTTVVVANVTAPTAGLTLGGGDCILEDSLLANPDNLVTVSATPAAGSNLTTIVLDGFQSGWTYNLAGLDTDGAGGSVVVSAIVAGKVTITLTGFAGAYSGTFEVQPPADSDIDHPNITAAATAASNLDPSVTATGNASLGIIVDAVADNVTALVSVSDAGANGFFSVGEAGKAHLVATFGDALDGSEAHTLVLKVPAGFNLTDAASLATFNATLPAGVTATSITGSSATGWEVHLTVSSVTGLTNVNFDVNLQCTATLGAGAKFTLDVAAHEQVLVDKECDDGNNLANNDSSAHSETSATSVRTLSGSIITNSNVDIQQLVLMVVDENNPLAATANIFDLFLQGQQGSFVVDSGFDFNPNHVFLADIESVVGSRDGAGNHVQLTDYSLQLGGGVATIDMTGNGNVQLDDDDVGNKGPDRTGYTSLIEGGTGTLDQVLTESNDGDGAGTTITDSGKGVDLIYGAGGTDTLNGGSGADVLRGGPGVDTLHGNDGNDVLVYSSGDHLFGDKGLDILRIDDGAIALTKIEEVSGVMSNQSVDLTAKDIHDIESILITQEAIPNASFGTTLSLSAKDVLDYTDSTKDADGYDAHTLFVVGSSGDKLNIDSGFLSGGHTYNAVDTGTTNTTAAPGMVFEVYNIQDNGVTVGTLMVDKDVAVNVV